MPNLPVVSARKLIKLLKKKGYKHHRSSGSHQIFVHHIKKITISIPIHKGRDLGRGITLSILKDAQISPEELLKK